MREFRSGTISRRARMPTNKLLGSQAPKNITKARNVRMSDDKQGDENSELNEASSKLPSIGEFLESHSEKPSKKIYENLVSDPIFAEVSNRKKLNYREMLLVVSTVVGALDKEIERLKPYENRLSIASKVINEPILGKPRNIPNEPGGIAGDPDVDEARWVLKYLTIRNVAGVFLIMITLSSGLFAFINKDYNSILSEREIEIGDLQEKHSKLISEKSILEQKLEGKKEEISAKDQTISSLENRLDAADQKYALLQKEFTKVSEAQKQGAQIDAEGLKNIGELKGKIESLKGKINLEKQNVSHWKRMYQGSKDSLGNKITEVEKYERLVSIAEADLSKAVDAWNQLLTYLYSKSGKRSVDLKTKDLKTMIGNLERYTKDIDGMKISLK